MLGALGLAWTRLRHRRLATALSAGSVCLGASLAMALLLLRAQGTGLLLHQPHGFDLLVGAKGSGSELTLNTLYHIERSPGTISWQLYRDLSTSETWQPLVAGAVPIAVGDNVAGCDLVATTPQFFAAADGGGAEQTVGWDPAHPPVIASGCLFRPGSIDAVVGSAVAAQTGLTLGATFRPTHGTGDTIDPSEVHQRRFTVVGELAPTGSIIDHSIFISLEGFWSIDEHEAGLHAQALLRHPELATAPPAQESRITKDGLVVLGMPDGEKRLSVLLVRSRSPFAAQMITYRLAAGDEAAAVNPTMVLAALLHSLLAPVAQLCAALIAVLLVVACFGILISCFQAVQSQSQELAVLRALGATRGWLLSMVVCEAGLIGFIGSCCALLPAHLLVGLISHWMALRLGQGVVWWQGSLSDVLVVVTATALSAMIGLLPGWLACRVQVAQQLC